ncbi:piggyBac transposable element-derived protein 4-like [Euwallacea similis]|uniref:piggyBac transposable element-derived protein 4-like n=1 Tax=Euwallacea similis TaxID=1736056 RepID=UPI00344BC85E
MYMPNKPNKYGIKIVMLCDNATKYVTNASPYLGKSTTTSGVGLANHFVESLTTPLHGSNRNITMDNWFTSVPLAKKLLNPPFKMTIIGTLRSNKPEIPQELLGNKTWQHGTSMFAFDQKITLVSYKPKKNKTVLLLSTMHFTDSLNEVTKKPEIIYAYNSIKGAVDTFDQMAQNICCNRKTRRWPLCIFYNMMNIASVNSYVIYHHNKTNQEQTPLSRLQFVLKLHEELTREWQEIRLQNVTTLPRKLSESISEILQLDQPIQNQEHTQNKGKRSYCSLCPTVKKRMTTTYCYKCNRALCGEHQIKICDGCI